MAEPTPERKKSLGELIERMGNGFDENMLDPLLESIYKEDEEGKPDPEPLPSESKVTFKEKKYVVIKVPGVSSSKNSVAAGLGSRIGSTFSAAARARRADQEAGGAEKDRLFYLKKAAAFNFGGDKIARTKGRFSKSPQAYQDPALSRDERFTARVKPFIGAAAPEKSQGSGDNIGKNVSDAFGRLGQSLDGWWNNKYDVLEEISEISNTTTKNTSEYVQENNELQEDNNDLQKKLVQVIAKQREEEDAAQKEARMEAQSRMTRTSGYSWGREKGKKKDDDDDGGGGNWLRRLRRLRKLGKRLRNPGKSFRALKRLGKQKLKKIPGVKQLNNFMKNKKPLQNLRNKFKGGGKPSAGGVLGKTKGAGGILSRLRNVKLKGKGRGGLLGTVAMLGIDLFGNEIQDGLSSMMGSMGMGSQAKTDDQLRYDYLEQEHTAAKVKETALFGMDNFTDGPNDRRPFLRREFERRGLELPTYGGTKPIPPKDKEATESDLGQYGGVPEGYKLDGNGKIVKMASGGVMAGEAGPESIFDLESVMGRKVTDKTSTVENSALAAAPFILGISRKVLETSGVGTESIKSFYEQQVAPLERMFGVSNFSIRSDVGKGVDQAQKASTGSVGGFDLGGLLGGIGSMLGSLFGGPAQAATPGGGAMGVTLSGTAADRVGNDPEFLQEVTRLSQKYQIKEGDLLGLMASESGLDPKSDNGKGFVGLIQFSADSAAAVGTTQAALKSMTRAQQMKYVEKYFDYWKLPKGASAGQLYATVFAPAYASKDDSTVLYSSPSAAYRGNAPLDSNGDGTITVGEMGGRIEKKKKEFGITDSGIRQQVPNQNATQQQQLPAAPPPATPDLDVSEHNEMPGPINPMPWSFSAQSSVAPPTVMPLPVIQEKAAGAQVIPFSIGGTQGFTTKTQGFEGRENTKTYDTRGRQYPSFQALHNARLQLQ